MNRLCFQFAAVLAACLIFSSLAISTRADLLFHDSFDYGPVGSDLLGKNGGLGSSNPWQFGGFNANLHNNFKVGANSLPFGNLVTSGNHVTTSSTNQLSGVTRILDASTGITGPGNTFYFSLLVTPKGTLNQGVFNGFFGLTLSGANNSELFLGKPGGGAINDYVIEDRGGTQQRSSNIRAVVDQTTLLVLKMEIGQANMNDRFTLFVNPTPGGLEPGIGNAIKSDLSLGRVNALTFYSSGAFQADELRIGRTYASVTAVPEPSSLCLCSMLLVGLYGVAKRSRKCNVATLNRSSKSI